MKWACGLIIGEADSPDSAEKLVRAFRDCPFSAFVGAFEDKFVWALLVPEGHLPWLQSLDQQPEALGLKRANVFLTPGEKVSFPNRVLRLPKRRETLLRAGHVVIAVSSTKLARAARPQFSIKEPPREAKMFRAKRGRSPRPVEFRPGICQGLEWA